MSTGKKKLTLVLGATFVALLLVELAFRLLVLADNGGGSFTALNDGASIPEDGVVELGHIIRRSSNRRLVYELKPDLDVTFFGVPLRTNSRGMRSPEREPDAGAFNIVGIGDSVMLGQGIAEGRNYLSVLEETFAGRCPDARVRTANLAVSGYNTVMEVESLRTKGLEVAPDLVVIEFVGNDLSMPNFVRVKRSTLDLRRSYALDYLRFRTTWDWNKSFWREMEIAGLELIPMEDPRAVGHLIDPSVIPEDYRDLVGWSAFEEALDVLARLGRKHEFRTLMISLQTEPGGLKTRALQRAREFGLGTLDVGQELSKRLTSNLSISSDDLHPSALAHGLAAEVLFDHLAGTASLAPFCG